MSAPSSLVLLTTLWVGLGRGFLVGGWIRLDTCVAPIYLSSPYDLLLYSGKDYYQYYGDDGLGLILAKYQVVSGQNYLAVFRYQTAPAPLHFGIVASISVDGVQKSFRKSRITPALDDVFAELGFPVEETAVIDCPQPRRKLPKNQDPVKFAESLCRLA